MSTFESFIDDPLPVRLTPGEAIKKNWLTRALATKRRGCRAPCSRIPIGRRTAANVAAENSTPAHRQRYATNSAVAKTTAMWQSGHPSDMYAWPGNPQYPLKVAFREGEVLYEVDQFGERLVAITATPDYCRAHWRAWMEVAP